MDTVTDYVGKKIKFYRKLNNLSISELADRIHKSKSTLSKYENGAITLDVETLNDISVALHVDIMHFFDESTTTKSPEANKLNAFFQKDGQYIYYYDGRKKQIVKSYLQLQLCKYNEKNSSYPCTFYMDIPSFDDIENCEFYYMGEINPFDLVTYATLINQTNPMERLGMCMLNPFHNNESTWGMMFGISYKPIAPFSLKFLISNTPLRDSEMTPEKLLMTQEELKLMKNLNMMLLNE